MTERQYFMLRLLERAFVVVALLMLMNALVPFMYDWSFTPTMGGDSGEGNLRFQVLSLGIYGTALLVLLAHLHVAGRLVASNLLILALLVLALFSAFWSPYPQATFRRAFALTLSMGFAVYLVVRFHPRELLDLLAWTVLCACLLSLFFSLLTPWGIHHWGPHVGIWRGTFGHKNELGRYMAVGMLLFLVLLGDSRGFVRLRYAAGLVLCGFLLAMSTSKTPLAVLLGLVVVWPLIKALRAGRMPLNIKLPVVMIVGFGGIVLLLVNFLALGLESLGRDMTLSGRTKLWELAISAGMDTPWFGAGYRAFWTEVGARDVYAHLGWGMNVANGHNGYLDVWLELGFVGVGIFTALVIVAARRIWRRAINSRDAVGTWYVLLLGFLAVYSITEKVILEQSELLWTLFIATVFYLTPRRVPVSAPAAERPAAAKAAAFTPHRPRPRPFGGTAAGRPAGAR